MQGIGDDKIHKIIETKASAAVREAIPEVFRFIKTVMIEMFDECYVVVTKAAATIATTTISAVRSHMADSM